MSTNIVGANSCEALGVDASVETGIGAPHVKNRHAEGFEQTWGALKAIMAETPGGNFQFIGS